MLNSFFDRLLLDFGSHLGPSWAVLGASWNHLGPSWGPLGGVLGRLGGVSLGGHDPTRTRGLLFLEASWGRLGLIFGRFLDDFWDEISILFLHYF